MARKENNWIAWAALAIALVALISVLGNAYLTGNFIRVNNLGTLGKTPVYTKADIDATLPNLIDLSSENPWAVFTLASDSDTSSKFSYVAQKYEIQLISASDNSATFKMGPESVEISEGQSKRIGLDEILVE